MEATTQRADLRDQFRTWRRMGGNWRLKGLIAAELTDAKRVGEVWPQPRGPTPRMCALGSRGADTHERSLARSVYGKDAIQNNEAVPLDTYISRLLTSESETELDVLWREALLETVISGAATRKIARETTTVTPVAARKGDLPTPEHEPFAATGAESASTDLSGEDYTPTAYDCEKHTYGVAVTDELIDQGEIDVIERNLTLAGAAVENAINRQYVTNAIDNANQEQDVAANEANVQDILEAVENVADNDFDPVDVGVLHHEFMTELADDPALNYLNFSRRGRELQAGDEEVFDVVAAGPELFIASDATYNGLTGEQLPTSNTFGWEADGEFGGFVHSRRFVHTVVYRDVQISELGEPITSIRDIEGGVASAWTDSVQPSNNAISRLER